MNAVYEKLTTFGKLVRSKSHAKKLDVSNYFTVMMPAHPLINDSDAAQPAIRFENRCPRAVKREVVGLWKTVFGKSAAPLVHG